MQCGRGSGDGKFDGMDVGILVCALDSTDEGTVEGTDGRKMEIGFWGEKDRFEIVPQIASNPGFVFSFRPIHLGTFRQTCTAWVLL